MKKPIIILAYFIVFWLFLPEILIIIASWLDEKLFNGLKVSGNWNTAGFFIFFTGFILMLTSVFQFRYYGKEYPVSATPAAVIVQKGLFSVWRHPIYLFAVITYAGLALMFQSYGFIFIVLPVFIVAVGLYIRMEEKGLARRFGKEYEQHRTRVGLIFPGLHHWLKFLAFLLFKVLFRIRVDKKRNIPPAPPFFIVSGHRSYLDTFLVCYAIPWPVKVISTFEMFREKNHRKIFGTLGAIPRKRYMHDFRSILAMKRALDQGYPIGIAPEGERSWTGTTLPFKPEVLKMFLKFSHIPILPVRIEGNYLMWPRWSPKMMRANIRVCFEEVVHVDEDMNVEKLEKILFEKIQPRTIIEQAIRCKSKNRVGNLSRVIYRCPACRSMDTLYEIPPGMLRCTYCGRDIEIDDKFNLKYTVNEEVRECSIDEVYQEIRITSSDLVPSPETLTLQPAALQLPGQCIHFAAAGSFFKEKGNTLVLAGTGIIYLTDLGIHFLHRNEVYSILFNGLGSATIESYYKLQLYVPLEKQLYQITLGKESVLKWQDTIVLIMGTGGMFPFDALR